MRRDEARAHRFGLRLVLVQCGDDGTRRGEPYFVATGRAPVGRLAAMSLWIAAALGGALSSRFAINRGFPSLVGGVDMDIAGHRADIIPATLAVLFLQKLFSGEGRMVGV